MNKEELQGRYIEIFPSSGDEMEYVLEKAERQANQPWDNVVRLRGIPFKASFLLKSSNSRKNFPFNFHTELAIFSALLKNYDFSLKTSKFLPMALFWSQTIVVETPAKDLFSSIRTNMQTKLF